MKTLFGTVRSRLIVLCLLLVAVALALLRWMLEPVKAYAEDYLVCWANHKGSEGTVHIGTTAIAELRSWELEHSAELIEDTVLADADKTFQTGNKSWSGNATAFWDETDTNGQEALDVGSAVTLKFYGEGTGTGAAYYTGTGIVESVRRSAGINGMVEAQFNFRGSGALAQTTV
jgi:hypothetical protein